MGSSEGTKRTTIGPHWTSESTGLPSPVNPTLEDILINEEIQKRGYREPKWKDQSLALNQLARVAATSPASLVDTLLGLALVLCGADTAGLSILEATPGHDPIFRWTNLAGALRSHIGGTTPRHFSPCGVCTDRGTPQLFSHPESYFTYFQSAKLPFVEALVIPVRVGNEIPATIWILTHGEGKKFDSEDVRIMTGLADFTGCALGLLYSSRTEQESRERLENEIEVRKQAEQELRRIQSGLESAIEIRTSQLRQLSARLLTAQDDEQRRIARELHDSVGQYLAAVTMDLSNLLDDGPPLSPTRKKHVDDALHLVSNCNSEVRTISYLLHPPLLEDLGLASAVSWYLDGFAKRSGMRVDFDCPEDLVRFSPEIEIALFRIVQQCLANIHRHSGSTIARIEIRATNDTVTMKVCDEGHGLPSEKLLGILEETHSAGVGIAGMRERIRTLGGRFGIVSSVAGTTVEASLPYTSHS